MPSRTRVYAAIPRTSYDANRLLGERESMPIGYATTLIRRNAYGQRQVALRHHDSDIVRYQEDGGVRFHTHGYRTRTTIQRMRAALPPLWTIDWGWRPRRCFLVYRNTWRVSMDDEPVTLFPEGGCLTSYYAMTAEELDRYADQESLTTMEQDIARERGRAARRGQATRERRRARGRQAPPPSYEEDEPITLDAGPASCHTCTHSEHYGRPCVDDPMCLCDEQCCCTGSYADDAAVHGRYFCFPHPSAEESAAAWDRAQVWLRPALGYSQFEETGP